MPFTRFEIDKWGPAKLREIWKQLEDAINLRAPLESESIEIEQRPDGALIGIKADCSPTDEVEGSGASGGATTGTAGDIYGALNGAVTLYHFVQAAPPESPPP